MSEKSKIELIVRGSDWGVQLDVKEFPIICPSCKKYLPELYHHNFSRYGQVGTVNCSCGKIVHLTDSDNIVEYIKCHSENNCITIDFKQLFHLKTEDFKQLKELFNYDIFEKHLNDRINLTDLIIELETEYNIKGNPIESDIPLPKDVEKWIGIIKTKAQQRTVLKIKQNLTKF